MTFRKFAQMAFLRLPQGWVLWAAPLILFMPVWLAAKALFWGTPALQFVPWRWIAGQMLAQMELPLWNPLSGMGAPLLANYQSAILYPPNWLLFALQAAGKGVGDYFAPTGYNLGLALAAWGQTVLVVFHLAWAGLGMYRLARRLGLNPLAQIVAGMSFGLSGYLVARAGFLSINAAAAWMPWIILSAEVLARPAEKENRKRIWLSSSLGHAMLLLAGHAQTAWYVFLLAAVWVIVRSPGRARGMEKSAALHGGTMWGIFKPVLRAGVLFGTSMLFGFLLSAAQLLPTGEYLLQSQRASQVDYQAAMTYSFWPWHLLTLLAPGIFGSPVSGDYWGYANYWEDAVYIGLLPFLLALGAAGSALRRRTKQNEARRMIALLLMAIAGISFLLALGENTPFFPWLYQHVPSFDMFQAPARFSLWAVFALALLSGIGADQWRCPSEGGQYWLRLGTMGAFAVMVGSGLGWVLLGDVSPTFIRAAVISGFWGTAAGLLSIYAPAAEGFQKQSKREPGMRRLPRIFSPLVEKKGSPEKPQRLEKPGPQSMLGRVTTGLQEKVKHHWADLVLLIVAADLISAGWGLNPGVDLDFYGRASEQALLLKDSSADQRVFLPDDGERTLKFQVFLRFDTYTPDYDWRSMREVMLPNLNLLEGIPSANNFDPLVPGRFDRWMQSLRDFDPKMHAWKLNLMGVGVVENMVTTPDGLVRFDPLPGGQRWRWIPCALIAASESSAWDLVMEAGPALLDRYVIVEGAGEAGERECANPSPEQALVEKLSEGAQHLELRVSSRWAGWLLISDTWYPGWTAELDGAAIPLLRGDYLFRALHVPAGDHRVRFVYTPESFRIGAVISLAAWLVCLTALFGADIVRRFGAKPWN